MRGLKSFDDQESLLLYKMSLKSFDDQESLFLHKMRGLLMFKIESYSKILCVKVGSSELCV